VPNGSGAVAWSTPDLPTCLPFVCELNPSVEFGMSTYSSQLNALVYSGCEGDRTLVGESTVYCIGAGIWSAAPHCRDSSCPSADVAGFHVSSVQGTTSGAIAHYYVECPNTAYSTTAEATCVLIEDRTLVWSPMSSTPVCVNYQCDLPQIDHAAVTPDAATNSISVTCIGDTELVGSSSAQCSVGGWTALPYCRDTVCPSAEVQGLVLGSVSGTGVGATAEYTVDCPLIRHSTTASATCELVGDRTLVWSPIATSPVCVDYVCQLPQIDNALVVFNSASNIATFTCEGDRDVIGSAGAECHVDGWSSSFGYCRDRACPSPELEGLFLGAGYATHLGGSASYHRECLPTEYTTYTERFCELANNDRNLVWSPMRPEPLPQCLPTRCQSALAVENGEVSNDGGVGVQAGQSVTVTCAEGFRLFGASASVQCENNGQWAAAPQCVTAYCPAYSTPTDLIPVGSVPLHPTQLTFAKASCAAGFHSTESQVTCSLTEDESELVWSELVAPTCVPFECAAPSVEYAISTFSRETNTVTFTGCEGTRQLIGTTVATCNFNGWSATLPHCRDTVCPSPGVSGLILGAAGSTVNSPADYYRSCLPTEYSTHASAKCELIDDRTLVWSTIAPEAWPQCLPTLCWSTLAVENGQVSNDGGSGVQAGQSVTVTCDAGFRLFGGSASVQCGNDGQWAAAPQCVTAYCPAYSTPTGLIPVGSVPLHPTQLTFAKAFCANGFYSTESQVTCALTEDESELVWSELVAPTCVPHVCAAPSVEYAVSTFSSATNSLTFTGCEGTRALIGSVVATCGATGWTALPHCRDTVCPSAVLSGLILGEAGTTVDSTADYTRQCAATEYSTHASATCVLVNDRTLVWSSLTVQPVCMPTLCSTVLAVTNGVVSNGGVGVQAGQSVTVACNPNYRLLGAVATVQCKNNGQWAAAPQCVSAFCPTITTPSTLALVLPGPSATATEGAQAQFKLSSCPLTFTSSQTVSMCTFGSAGLYWSVPALPTCNADCVLSEWYNVGTCAFNAGANAYQVAQKRDVYRPAAPGGQVCGDFTRTSTCAAFCSPIVLPVGFPASIQLIVTSTGNSLNSVTTYKKICLFGTQSTTTTATCQANTAGLAKLTWTVPEAPECSIAMCPALVAPANGKVLQLLNVVGASAVFSCNSGYLLVDATARFTCQSSLTWSSVAGPTLPRCVPLACAGFIPTSEAQYFSVAQSGSDKTIEYKCAAGYSLVGKRSEYSCNPQGKITPADQKAHPFPICVRSSSGRRLLEKLTR
jgi:hypothetical protein